MPRMAAKVFLIYTNRVKNSVIQVLTNSRFRFKLSIHFSHFFQRMLKQSPAVGKAFFT